MSVKIATNGNHTNVRSWLHERFTFIYFLAYMNPIMTREQIADIFADLHYN